METVRHPLMDNRVQLYMRPGSPHWQCSASVGGKQRRATTKEESLARAKSVAYDWYLSLMGKYKAGELKEGKTFREAAAQFVREFTILTEGERNERYVAGKGKTLDLHLLPYFGDKVLTDITPGLVQEYRMHRMTSRVDPETGEYIRPTRSTMHKEIVIIRQVLKTANSHGWVSYVPNLSAPYKTSGKVSHRAWFSPEEYKRLYEATRERAKTPKKERWRQECENMHDFVLFMVNTGLRPDEALRLEFRDVAVVTDEPTGERILEIEVRGKRGVGYCKSMPGAVLPFQRLKERRQTLRREEAKKEKLPDADKLKLDETERLFPKMQRELFNNILDELKLKTDRDGQARTAYSLRHTYICFRLMEGADIYQIAKNCRTSVEMIETYYASHIKNMLDASAINVRKAKPTAKAKARVVEK